MTANISVAHLEDGKRPQRGMLSVTKERIEFRKITAKDRLFGIGAMIASCLPILAAFMFIISSKNLPDFIGDFFLPETNRQHDYGEPQLTYYVLYDLKNMFLIVSYFIVIFSVLISVLAPLIVHFVNKYFERVLGRRHPDIVIPAEDIIRTEVHGLGFLKRLATFILSSGEHHRFSSGRFSGLSGVYDAIKSSAIGRFAAAQRFRKLAVQISGCFLALFLANALLVAAPYFLIDHESMVRTYELVFSPDSKLTEAAKSGDASAVEAMVDAGWDPDDRGSVGLTGLHAAFASASVDPAARAAIVRALLDAGANVNAGDLFEFTPLAYAIGLGKPAADGIGLLLSRGADVGSRATTGVTPLHLAARSGFEAGARMLVEAGADVDAVTESGATPLMMAVQTRDPDGLRVAELLVGAGANVNASDDRGLTPLHLAVSRQGEPAVRLLLSAGADPGLKAHDGMTAEDVARAKELDQVVEILRKAAK